MSEEKSKIEENFKLAFDAEKKGDLKNAAKFYKKVLDIDEKNFEAIFSIGVLFLREKKFDEARKFFLKAISINPNYPNAYSNLGIAMKELRQNEKSIICFKKAIEIDPKHKMAYNNLGIALQGKGNYKEALDSYKKAIKIDPDNSNTLDNLGSVFTELGEHEKSRIYFEKAIKIDSKNINAHSNLLFNICWSNNSNDYLEYAEKYYNLIPKYENSKFIYTNNIKKDSLKVGFVSGDFKNHPVTYFLLDTLMQLKKKGVELFAYSNNENEDQYTQVLKKNFTHWNLIFQKSDSDSIKMIRNDKIDILFDLSGHTKKNRLAIFKNRCAPVQVTWSGWLASTGIKEIDYIIGDPHVTPYSDQKKFIEKIYQLKTIWQSLSISVFNPKISFDNKNKENSIIFGSFNNTIKLNDHVINIWSKILSQVYNSKLFLKYGSFDSLEIKNNIITKFSKNGISKEKIIIEGYSKRDSYLECYNKIDIILDSFPINGGATNFDASYMGVPILTKLSENNAWFRSGISINKNLNMDDWIAKNDDDYISKAIKFSENKKYLIDLKKELRNLALKSSLFNSQKFSNDFYEMLLDVKKK